MAAKEPILEIRNLSAGYRDQPIVHDFSVEIGRPSISTLIGGNGAGKSTLLKSIFGLTRRFAGEILFEGMPIHELEPTDRLRAGIGIVPQGRCNFPAMTVRENLLMGTYLLPRAAAARAIDRVLAIFPMLRRKWSTMAGQLSGGEQQLLETAMALEGAPRLLLLDEPSLGLAPIMQREIFAMISSLSGEGVTVIMAEQNVYESLVISDTAIVLELGRKYIEGPAREVMYDPNIRSAFLGGEPDSPQYAVLG